jgi:chemotaxis protein methyltransferase CheR
MLSPPASIAQPRLSVEQFERVRRLALKLAGIELVDRHRELLARRRSRREGFDPAAFDALLDAAERGEPAATGQLLCLLTTKFTAFFRHPAHFEIAATHALSRGHARIWSAAAATGEEPYSLAMAMIELFNRDDPPVEILATDVDVGALAVAQRGEYAEAALQALDPARRERFFLPTGSTGRSKIDPAVQRLVEFRALNLVADDWDVESPFDVIFCRNVLMYLQASHRRTALERIATLLAPGGLLMLDPAEHLADAAAGAFTPVASGVFSRKADS